MAYPEDRSIGVRVDEVPGIRVGPIRPPLAAAAATAEGPVVVWNLSSKGLRGMLSTRDEGVFWWAGGGCPRLVDCTGVERLQIGRCELTLLGGNCEDDIYLESSDRDSSASHSKEEFLLD